MFRVWLFCVFGVTRFPEQLNFFIPLTEMATRSRRRTSTPTCAVNCGREGENDVLYPCCNQHRIHLGCLSRLFETTDEPSCPICRDPFLKIVKDLCVNYPFVDSDDDDEEYNPETDDDDDDDDDEPMSRCPARALREEVKDLRRLVRDLSHQYVRNYDANEGHLTRTPPSLSPPVLRSPPDLFP